MMPMGFPSSITTKEPAFWSAIFWMASKTVLSGPIVKTSCPFSLSNWRTVIEILRPSKNVVSVGHLGTHLKLSSSFNLHDIDADQCTNERSFKNYIKLLQGVTIMHTYNTYQK